MDRKELLLELKKAYGTNAEFRDGQEEAIWGILQRKRMLVVQKTGWGKSLVYFLATKILRQESEGFTLIVSPLLVLMDNQIDSANKLGLDVETINSSNPELWGEVMEKLDRNQADALIISPERLANEEFRQKLTEKLAAQISLFVVDEAHCISDWGHDFRPDYRRIVDIINKLPSNIPVLATTATANDRVIKDIKAQLGEELVVSRGSLMRESLAIESIELKTKEDRLAWLADNINRLPGTGLIYCLTTDDCRLVTKWLSENGILSESYYAGIEKKENKDKSEIVERFMKNQIKVLVATVAFGMGFDKADIGFVIHFQKPKNLIEYYQQIGRAGRGINKAYAVLLCGVEDDAINNYFIDSAFPTEDLMDHVVETVIKYPGLKIREFEKYINLKQSKIEACVKYLLVNGDIYEERHGYYKTPRPWKPDLKKSREITEIRKEELRKINEFTRTGTCYMKFIAEVLDDSTAKECGRCSNCLGHSVLPFCMDAKTIEEARKFIREDYHIIDPRKKWPVSVKVDGKNLIAEDRMCETGRVLSNYGDGEYGRLTVKGKYQSNHFDKQLVEASYEILKDFVRENQIKWVTNIPSLRRPELVKTFAKELACRLSLDYREAIVKIRDTRCQKDLNTSYMQYQNAESSFTVIECSCDPVLLVDDMVDSRWTFTVCGYKLRNYGSGRVYPFALANSAGRNGDE